MKKKILLLLILCGSSMLGFSQSFDRSVLASDGATSSTGAITLDWTLGELATTTIITQNGMLTQGFHQPTLSVSKVLTSNKLADYYQIQVMPNPVSTYLNVHVKSELENTLMVDLLDLNGKVVKREELLFPYNPVQFDMGTYPSGLYVVRVMTDKNEPIKMFKINKSK
jgi:hypothetical protein